MSLSEQYMVMLERVLNKDFLEHLPPLMPTTRPVADQQKKNLSRAFSAFTLHNLCDISKVDAAKAVVDDFDDFGIDAIFYHAASDILYFVQSKLKAAEKFSQDEALAFCQGVRKLIKQDFSGFNNHVKSRQVEIEDALDNCSHIQLVVAHTGSGISEHAKKALDELLADESHGEERLIKQVSDYDSLRVVDDLRTDKAYERVDTDLDVQKCSMVSDPKLTYFGLVKLTDLVKLHDRYDKALYEKNIRTFLGNKTDVNISIQKTLETNPQDFLYLNNGVTALCQEILPKGASPAQGGSRKLRLRGFSVINGAQTIASSAKFLAENKGKDINTARVSITLIKADADGDFGKSVTRARNHQNPVSLSDFAALDDEQERLRRELAHFGIHYAYKAEVVDGSNDPNKIRLEEAIHALALFQDDPRYAVWLKKEPARLLKTESEQYKAIFTPTLTAQKLVNAVRVNRYVQQRIMREANYAVNLERLIYKHGNFSVAWILLKRLKTSINSASLIDFERIKSNLSTPFDTLRQSILDNTRPLTYERGPLSLFRNQTYTIPLLQEILVSYYGLSADPVVGHKKGQQKIGEPYPIDLFNYLISKAPQIGNLI